MSDNTETVQQEQKAGEAQREEGEAAKASKDKMVIEKEGTGKPSEEEAKTQADGEASNAKEHRKSHGTPSFHPESSGSDPIEEAKPNEEVEESKVEEPRLSFGVSKDDQPASEATQNTGQIQEEGKPPSDMNPFLVSGKKVLELQNESQKTSSLKKRTPPSSKGTPITSKSVSHARVKKNSEHENPAGPGLSSKNSKSPVRSPMKSPLKSPLRGKQSQSPLGRSKKGGMEASGCKKDVGEEYKESNSQFEKGIESK